MWSEIIVQFNPRQFTQRPSQRILKSDVPNCTGLEVAVTDNRVYVMYCGYAGKTVKAVSWCNDDVFEICGEGRIG